MESDLEEDTSEAAASDRQGMHGASFWRKPPAHVIPVATSNLHAGNHYRKFGSTVKIDAAHDARPDGGGTALSSSRRAAVAARSTSPSTTTTP